MGFESVKPVKSGAILWERDEKIQHSATADKFLAPVSQTIKGIQQMELDTTCNPSES